MRRFWTTAGPALLAAAVALTPAAAPGQPARPALPLSDEDALRRARLSPTDAGQLIDYLRQRTLTDTEQGKVREVIRRLGADDFDERQRASEEVESFGPAAVGPLKAAERDPDAEIAYRAREALRRLETVPHAAVAAAAVRALLKARPPEAAEVLLAFLPLADSEVLADQIREALVGLAVRDGKPDPAVVAGLADGSPVRRGAAAVALVEGAPAAERGRFKETFPQVVAAVRKEQDLDTRFRGVWALVRTTRDKEFVSDLIGMLPDLPRGRLWQAEDLLLQLAGGAPPDGGRFGKTPESVDRARAAWLRWWQDKEGGVDLARFEYAPRVAGFTDLVELDTRWGTGRVTTLGPDLKERGRMTNLTNPYDARVMPNGNTLVAEQNAGRVTERTPAGKEAAAFPTAMPMGVELLADGKFLVAGRNEVAEYDRAGVKKAGYARPQHDAVAARRLPNGETLVLTAKFQNNPHNLYRLDAKLKEVGKYTVGQTQHFAGLEVLSNDRVLVTETGRVAEYDLSTGKAVWTFDVRTPTSVQRLPNGNTLIANNSTTVREVDPAGEVLWEYKSPDGLNILRAYRR